MHTVDAPAPVAPTGTLTIDTVLRRRLVQPKFQPIVDLSTRTVMGLEALARGPAGTELEFPDRLFAAGRAAGRLGELDMLCFERGLEGAIAAQVPPPLLFANGEPAVMDQPMSPRLIELVNSRPPFRTILEYTERALPAVPGSLLRLSGAIQQGGNGIALDDVGVDPMSLAFLPILEPEVIKLDMSLLRNPDTEHSRAVCTAVQAEAQRTGAVVIAEGVETEADLAVARQLGAHWGQGWLFGRPEPIDQVRHRFDPEAAKRLRGPRPGFHQPPGTPFEIAAQHRPAVAGTVGNVTAAVDRLRNTAAAHDHAVVIVSVAPDVLPGIPGSAEELQGRGGAVIVADRPVPGEFVVAVVGSGSGHVLCGRAGAGAGAGAGAEMVELDHLPAAAAIARVLLHRMR